MSEKEMASYLLDSVPAYKMGYVVAYLQGLIADETADDAFCEALCEEYESDPEKGDFITFDEMVKMSGVDMRAVQDPD